MVDLNRQIRATQARQGGFSAHVLPGAVAYAPIPRIIAYPTATGVEFIGEYATATTRTSLTTTSSGGPFDEPYINKNEGDRVSSYIIELGDSSPGTGDYTLEGWFKAPIPNPSFPAEYRFALAFYDFVDAHSIAPNYTVNAIGTYIDVESFSNNKRPVMAHLTELNPNSRNDPFPYGLRIAENSTSLSFPEEWSHVAIVRSGSSHVAYANGSIAEEFLQEFDYEGREPVNFANAAIRLWSDVDWGQMRYIKGRALYSGASFAVPTEPFFVPS
jgi:hypothetical protein